MMTPEEKQALVALAIEASQHAYAPYSNFPVGAALRTKNHAIYTGCNVENAAYPVCICGERTALVKAVSEGQREFEAIAVATRSGGSPCGMCRQMLFEFAPDLLVIIADFDGNIVCEMRLSELLVGGFGPDKLA
jgi:cytidine deaminase